LGARDAPKRLLEPKRFRWWRGFWDYSGGNMTDQGTHPMDVIQWMTGNFRRAPDVFTAVFEYPAMLGSWSLNYTSAYDYDWSITLAGEKAAMVLDGRGYRVYKEVDPSATPWSTGPANKLIAEMADRDSSDLHPKNFLDCVRSRREPNCTVEIAAAAVAGPHLANIAWKEGRKVTAG